MAASFPTRGLTSTVITTGLARAGGVLGGLALVLVLGNFLGAAAVGVFASAQAVCMVGVLVARGGHDSLLLRSVSRAMADRDMASVQSHVRFATHNSFKIALGLSSAVGVWVFANPFGLLDPASRGLLFIMLPAVPAAVLAWQFAGFFKGLGQTARAVLLESNCGAVVLTGCAFVAAVSAGLAADLSTVGGAFLVGNVSSMGIGAWLYRRWTSRRVAPNAAATNVLPQKPAVSRSSRQFLLINVATYMNQAGSFFVAGLLLPKEQVGLLWAAERLTLALNFIYMVVNPILAPRIAAAFQWGRLDELTTLVARARRLCALVCLPAVFVLGVFPRTLLAFVGAEFESAAPYLQIMLIGHVVRIVSGPIDHMLAMTQYEQSMKNLLVTLFVVGLVAYPALIWVLGPTGFAVCYAALLAARYLSCLVLVRRKFGPLSVRSSRPVVSAAPLKDERDRSGGGDPGSPKAG